jgi:D-galactarolactone cycloisomerase
MKITAIRSHVLQCDMEQELGYSQAWYTKRTAHLVEVSTDEGVTGWGECFGPGNVALGNKAIVERVIAPLLVGRDALAREANWHLVYNALRDHGQKGMPMQALSGVDIACWDIAGKVAGLPLYRLLGGPCRDRLPVYGYGMMLRRDVDDLAGAFREEAAAIREMGFAATKMKVGLGPRKDVALAQAVREGVGPDFPFMVDANHAYTTPDALYMGRALDELGAGWFEEPVAPEDRDGYRELRAALTTPIAGGEAEFGRYGWRRLLEGRCLSIAQPEVCGLGGITEFLKVRALAEAHFTPVVNHVWGSAISVAVNMHLLMAQPDMPGGLFPWPPMLEFDTTPNLFRDELPVQPLDIHAQITAHGGVAPPDRPGHGIEPSPYLINRFEIV